MGSGVTGLPCGPRQRVLRPLLGPAVSDLVDSRRNAEVGQVSGCSRSDDRLVEDQLQCAAPRIVCHESPPCAFRKWNNPYPPPATLTGRSACRYHRWRSGGLAVSRRPVNQSAVGRPGSTTNLRIFGAERVVRPPEANPRVRKLSKASLVAARSAGFGMIGVAAKLAAGTS